MRSLLPTSSRSHRSVAAVLAALVTLGASSAAGAVTTKKTTTTAKKKSSSTTTTKKASGTGASVTTSTKAGSTGGSGSSTTSSTVPVAKSRLVFIPGAGRVLDLGAGEVAKLAAGGRVEADVRGASGLAASGSGTVILDVTTSNPVQAGRVTLSPVAPDYARSVVSATASFNPGPTTVSRVSVPVGAGGLVRVATTAGPTGLAVSVVGWVVTAPAGASEPSAIALESCRLLDTASGLGGLKGEVTPAKPFDLPTLGLGKIPAAGSATLPSGVILMITATQAAGSLEVSAVPSGMTTPSVRLDMAPGQVTTAAFVVPVSTDARTAFYVSASSVYLTVDAVGWIDRDGLAKPAGPC